MRYENIKQAIFLNRPNRFLAEIIIDGKTELCHVKNTGRLGELLFKGATIYVQSHDDPNRKTNYSLISVKKGKAIVNVDSQAPNKIFYEWVNKNNYFKDIISIKPEQKWGESRFDFTIDSDSHRTYVEVKGVTLEKKGVALFPDAPTARGLKHLKDLILLREEGFGACVVFIIKMEGIRYFMPNYSTHEAFGNALKEAESRGVNILAIDCSITKDSIEARDFVKIKL
jgi:sugar fermentation stimulation protein A